MKRERYTRPVAKVVEITSEPLMFIPGSASGKELPSTPETPGVGEVKDYSPFDSSDLWTDDVE